MNDRDPAARAADETMNMMRQRHMGGLIACQVQEAVDEMERRMRSSGGPEVVFDRDAVDTEKVERAGILLAEAGVDVNVVLDVEDDREHWCFGTGHAARPGAWLRQLQRKNHEWRKEAVPGAHPLAQAGHTSVEANELLDLMVKHDTYDRELDVDHAKSEAGDVVVALLSFLSMMEWDAVECVMRAKGKNDGRDWGDRAGGSR